MTSNCLEKWACLPALAEEVEPHFPWLRDLRLSQEVPGGDTGEGDCSQRSVVAPPAKGHCRANPPLVLSALPGPRQINHPLYLPAATRAKLVGCLVPSVYDPLQSEGAFVSLAPSHVAFLWPRKDLFPVVKWLVIFHRTLWHWEGKPPISKVSPILGRRRQKFLLDPVQRSPQGCHYMPSGSVAPCLWLQTKLRRCLWCPCLSGFIRESERMSWSFVLSEYQIQAFLLFGKQVETDKWGVHRALFASFLLCWLCGMGGGASGVIKCNHLTASILENKLLKKWVVPGSKGMHLQSHLLEVKSSRLA